MVPLLTSTFPPSSPAAEDKPRPRPLDSKPQGRRLLLLQPYRGTGVGHWPGTALARQLVPRGVVDFFQKPLPFFNAGLGMFYAR